MHISEPQPVTIHGYGGSTDVPYLTPDGNFLVFDSRTDKGSSDVKTLYAKRIDDRNFQFAGEVKGINQPGTINFEVTIDGNNNLYFTRIDVPPHPAGRPTIYRGVWNNGKVSNIAPVGGLEPPPGTINQDPSISHDGNMMFFDVWDYPNKTIHHEIAARKSDGSFEVLHPGDPRLMPLLVALKDTGISNFLYHPVPQPAPGITDSLMMGPVEVSHSKLVIAFTLIVPTASGRPEERYFIATRNTPYEPFGPARTVISDGHVAEGCSFSADDSRLYFHLSNGNGGFDLFYNATEGELNGGVTRRA